MAGATGPLREGVHGRIGGQSLSKVIDATRRIPIRQGEWRQDPDGRVVVTRKKFGRFGTFLLRLARVRPQVTLHLDAMGSVAWDLMDGHRSVADILPLLEERFPEEGRLDERLGTYLSRLVQAAVVRLDEPA